MARSFLDRDRAFFLVQVTYSSVCGMNQMIVARLIPLHCLGGWVVRDHPYFSDQLDEDVLPY